MLASIYVQARKGKGAVVEAAPAGRDGGREPDPSPAQLSTALHQLLEGIWLDLWGSSDGCRPERCSSIIGHKCSCGKWFRRTGLLLLRRFLLQRLRRRWMHRFRTVAIIFPI